MQTVRLGEYGKDITISDRGYELIQKFVSRYEICRQCQLSYTEERPQVALNLCLPCFMGGYPMMKHYIGQDMLGEGTETHLFLDEKGYVHYSTLNTTQLIPYTYATLQHWHYPVPAQYREGDETIQLSEVYWSIESDFATVVGHISGSAKKARFMSHVRTSAGSYDAK